MVVQLLAQMRPEGVETARSEAFALRTDIVVPIRHAGGRTFLPIVARLALWLGLGGDVQRNAVDVANPGNNL